MHTKDGTHKAEICNPQIVGDWKEVWRKGIVPQLGKEALEAMRAAIKVGFTFYLWPEVCKKADALCGDPTSMWVVIHWMDNTPRQAMMAELLAEVESNIAGM